jgi:negative regulator of sigma E activity
MNHLEDKVADFFYGELSASEMGDARNHVAECADCRVQVANFERTHLALKASPDQDPPRHIVFAPPGRRPWRSVFDWPAAVPSLAAAAALIIAVMVAMRPVPAPASVSTPAPVVVQAQDVDYNRIIDGVRQSERAWLVGELEKRDREIRQLQGELAYYESFQRSVLRQTMENASSVQLLAQRTRSQD